jgi:hypothetical protein
MLLRMLANADGNADAASTIIMASGSYVTDDAVPTSLPGTLVSAAPA